MKIRKELNKKSVELMQTHDFRDGNGKAITSVPEIFRAYLDMEIVKYRDFFSKPHNTDDEAIKRRPVTEALSLYNDEMRVQRLEQLRTLGYQSAVIAYLGTQYVRGLKIEENSEAGTVDVKDDVQVILDPVDFYKFMCTADLAYIEDAACIFADNVATRFIAQQKLADNPDCDPEKVYITKNSLSESYIALRKKKGWDFDTPADISKGKLLAEMNEIVAMMCFLTPDDIKEKKWLIKMNNYDVEFVDRTIVTTNGASKDAANSDGKYVIRNEATVIRAIFRAMHTRYNGGHYDFAHDSKANEKKARTTEPNHTMGENPKSEEFKPTKPAKAGPVESKKSGKKSGKKSEKSEPAVTLGTPEA